ncbi:MULTISPECIES: hypothetical protein [unclassified Rhizobium]|uniref:hypothetical protein n=1 Tax=unclassified Rhizobium TaxID=2613769 RepID=UPI001FCD0FAF|nr:MULTISPECIES: hypothetical protein [unclassified Rhizobium]
MTTLARRTLLVSGTAALALGIFPFFGAVAPASLSALLDQQALARGGSDDGGGSGSDSSGSSHDDSNDSSDDSSNDDGPDHDAGDDHGDDGAEDDDGDDDGNGKGRGGNRDEIRLIVNQAQLQGLVNGTMIPVDQNGVRLAFEIEQEHGKTEIKLRAPKGTLTGVTVVPAP